MIQNDLGWMWPSPGRDPGWAVGKGELPERMRFDGGAQEARSSEPPSQPSSQSSVT